MGSDPPPAIPIRLENNFNPRSPHGERLHVGGECRNSIQISIHAPRMGSDTTRRNSEPAKIIFQSTLPAWGATRAAGYFLEFRFYFNPRSPHGERPYRSRSWKVSIIISIHAPRMGSDYAFSLVESTVINFNPRSPHGERPRSGISQKDRP